MRIAGELCTLISVEANKHLDGGEQAMIFDSDDAKTMKSIGYNVLGLVCVTVILVLGATLLG